MQPMEPSQWPGHYFDGRSPVRHEVIVTVGVGGLYIQKGAETLWWPYEQVRQTEGIESSGQVRLEKSAEKGDGSLESLVVSDPKFLAALEHMTPRWAPEFGKSFRKASRRHSQRTVILLCAAAAVALLWILYTWAIPAATDFLAAYVPASWEERLGLAVTEQLAPPEIRCADGELTRALDQIASTLLAAEQEVPYTFHIAVADLPVVNAFAGPGGHIVILRGLLQKTETPEELAGVLAHEMQHILQRHPTRAVLREMSTSGLIAVLSGNAEAARDLLQAAGTLGELRYSRRDEAAADRAGIRMLQAAQIRSDGLIEFLGQMEGGNPLQYFSTHPNTSERIQELRALAAQAQYTPQELLPGYQWADVKNRCEPGSAP